MIKAEDRKNLGLKINKFYWLELRRILWKNGISPQEFFSFVTKLLVTGDHRIHEMMEEAKIARAKKEVLDIVHTDDESMYSLIEQALSNRKEEER